MRAICCAILSFAAIYTGKQIESKKYAIISGLFILTSWILFITSIVLMFLGL